MVLEAPARGRDIQLSEAQPSPVPGSAPRRRFALEDAPPRLRDNFMVEAFASLSAEEQQRRDAVTAARIEAGELYGDDAAAELAAIEAGTHPLQRLDNAAR